MLDHFGDPEKKRTKVASKKSGALTGRAKDTHVGSKMIPRIFKEKLKKATFAFYVIS